MGVETKQMRRAADIERMGIKEVLAGTKDCLGVAVANGAVYQIDVDETTIHVTANTASGSFTMRMPNIGESRGRIYSIQATIANSKAVTLTAIGSYDWTGDFTIDADDDAIMLYSDGRKWWVIANEIA